MALDGQDVVVSALGVGKLLKSNLFSIAMPAIVRLMEERSIRRVIFTSAFGVGDTYADLPLLPRVLVRLLLRDLYRDKAEGEVALRNSQLDWTLVYPSGLSNRAGTGSCRAAEHLALSGMPSIARADVAAFLLGQIERTDYIRKGVMISA
jgi:putative NADH-flavin reductase